VAGWAENCGELVRRAERAHRKLISLIEQGDGEQAEIFWRRHMQIVRGLLFGDGHTESIVEILD
jgi:DNA-binding GntR family transcriptional regulator